MKCKSLRKLTKKECRMLAEVMGFGRNDGLARFEGRYVKIILKSPKEMEGVSGKVYRND